METLLSFVQNLPVFSEFIWTLVVLLLCLLLAPGMYFLVFGWQNRKQEILNHFNANAAVSYLRRFQSPENSTLIKEVDDCEQACSTASKASAALRDQIDKASALVSSLKGEGKSDAAQEQEQNVERLRRQAVEIDANVDVLNAKLIQVKAPALLKLKEYYESQFGRKRFVIPFLLLFLFSFILLSACAVTAIRWQETGVLESYKLTIILAILGGYTWVVSDLITRARCDNIIPSSLLWSSFRLVIAVPVGYAFGKAFGWNPSVTNVMAYLMGTLPTSTIMSIGRRFAVEKFPQSSKEDRVLSDVQKLPSVDFNIAESFAEEGVTSFNQLAYADPVKLSIRTGINFSSVLCSAGEALVAIYLMEKDKLTGLRKYGISGSYECAALWNDLQCTVTSPARIRAEAIVTNLAKDLGPGYTKEGLENVLTQVANDPYTKFQLQVWN